MHQFLLPVIFFFRCVHSFYTNCNSANKEAEERGEREERDRLAYQRIRVITFLSWSLVTSDMIYYKGHRAAHYLDLALHSRHLRITLATEVYRGYICPFTFLLLNQGGKVIKRNVDPLPSSTPSQISMYPQKPKSLPL